MSKEQKYGAVSAAIFLSLFVFMLFVFGFTTPFPPPEEEGILINFGDSDFGSGQLEPAPSQSIVQAVPETKAPEETTPPVEESNEEASEAVEEVNTQDFDEAAAIESAKKEAEKKKAEEERKKELERQKEIERQKELQRQEEERKRKEEEERLRKQKQQEAINSRAQNLFGGKNTSGDNTGEGDSGKEGNQGSKDGSVNSNNRLGSSVGGNGIKFDLNGRGQVSLPTPPKDKIKESGLVVVEIYVDKNGNVISAVPGKRGSTTVDKELYELAKKYALKSKFTADGNAPEKQVGKIYYDFKIDANR
jgi:outer membrane biosynthesis protein TonB